MNFKKKSIMKSIIAIAMVLIIGMNMNVMRPKAADVSVTIALSASSVSVGQSVTATVNVNGGSLSAYTMYVSYNAGVLQFNSGSGAKVGGGGGTIVISGTGSGSISLSFSAIANGSSSISTSGSDFLNIDGNELSVAHAGVNVTVATAQSKPDSTTQAGTTEKETTEQTTEDTSNLSDNCNLKSLQISPGTLEPAFSAGTTSYFVQVEKDVTSMVVSATAEDSKAKTQVYGAGLIEPGENTVKIVVTAENGAVKSYVLRVLAGEDVGEANVTIDEEFYKFTTNETVDVVPDGFTETTLTYKDWEVLAFQSPNKELTIVCLVDVEENFRWFMYDAENDTFTPYKEFSTNYNRYIILPIPDDINLPYDYQVVELEIDGTKVEAIKAEKFNDNQMYLLYAMNIESGEGLYLYDKVEGAFMRYVPMLEEAKEAVATTTDVATVTDTVDETPEPESKDSNLLLYILIGVSALAFLFFVLFIFMIAKNSQLKRETEEAEDMVESLGGGRGVDRSVLDEEGNAPKSSSTYNLEELKANEPEKKDEPEAKIELPRGRKLDKNTSFVDTINNIEPINLDANNTDATEEKETEKVENIVAEEKKDDGIGLIPGFDMDFGEVTSEGNVLDESYDASKDSAFADTDKIDDDNK